MSRIVLLLVVASVAMFALVLKTAPRALPYIGLWDTEDPQPSKKVVEATTKPPSAKVQAPTKSGSHRVTTPAQSSAPATTRESDQATRSVRNLSSEKEVTSAKRLAIGRDSATLYAVNSSKGTVLTVLSKGTVVEPNLQLLDAADNWTLVRVPDLNMFGFVQTANLVRTSPPQPVAR